MEEFDFTEDSTLDNGSKKQKYVLIALIAATVILAGAVGYMWYLNSSANDENERLTAEFNLEKSLLTDEMVALKVELDSLHSDNTSLNSQLDSSRIEVQVLLDKITQTEATNRSKMRQYEKELGTLRDIMRSYVHQIDSLNALNRKLVDENAAVRKEAANTRKQAEELTKQVETLTGKVSAGSVLKAYGLTTEAYNEKGKTTDRSSRVSYLVTSLTLGENELAEKGPVMVYVRVKDPGDFLLVGDESGAFEYNGEMMNYSAAREVDYQGAAVNMSVYLHGVSEYTKGTYTVEVYSDKALLGTTELIIPR